MPATSRSTDILAAIFFVLAGAWLIIAILYSFLVLCFLRMRARGQLDSVYDEDFGRVYLFGGSRYYVPLGCIFRRYLIHLQREQGRSSSSRRFMTRAERRMAMEQLLIQKGTKGQFVADEERGDDHCNDSNSSREEACDIEEAAAVATSRDESSLDSPLCCICLGNYEEGDTVFHSGTCSHQFHQECILDWLERQANTDCPCCRVPLVSEEDVWKRVKLLRKQRRKEIRKSRSSHNLQEEIENEEPTENETESSEVVRELTSLSSPDGSGPLEARLSSDQTKGDDVEAPLASTPSTTTAVDDHNNFNSHSIEI